MTTRILTLVLFVGLFAACQTPPARSVAAPLPPLASAELPTGAWTAVAADSDFAREVLAQAARHLGLPLEGAQAPRLRALFTQVVAGTNVRAYVAVEKDGTWKTAVVELFQDLGGKWSVTGGTK